MNRTDPRARYDDLIVDEETVMVQPSEFESLANTDASKSGWAVGAVVLDDRQRILLVDNHWATGWIVPSGGVKPDETLSDALIREVAEEGGVEVTPVRPHAILESLVVNKATEETTTTTFIMYEAHAETTRIEASLGAFADEVEEARWFETLPADVYNRELTERVYRRCTE